MIKWVRLDERMIHGQVATKWSRTLGVDRIVVADDTAAASDIMQKSLMMAAPATCKTAIVTVDKAVSLCNDPRAAGLKILLIVSTPENLLRVAKEVKDIPQINVGNYGRIAPKHGTEARKTYTKNLYAYEDEVEVLRQVMATGIPAMCRPSPMMFRRNFPRYWAERGALPENREKYKEEKSLCQLPLQSSVQSCMRSSTGLTCTPCPGSA